eukprot:jgi/Ulvmu1/9613/UM054_0043.1
MLFMPESTKTAHAWAYKGMMVISVAFAFADQATDILFVVNLISSDAPRSTVTGMAALVFVLFFAFASGIKAVSGGRGIKGFFLAATGLHIMLGTWRACIDPNANLQQHLKGISDHFAAESVIEGMPLTFLALSWLYTQTQPCQFVTCDPAAIAANFPPYVHTLPPSQRLLSATEVTAMQGSTCNALPLSSDGWFTMPYSTAYQPIDRSSSFFERVIEFPLPGVTAANGTVLTTDDFSCAGWSAPDHDWLGFFQVPAFRNAWIPILSAVMGMLASAYHLTRTHTTDASTSLWALPPLAPATSAARLSAVAPAPASAAAEASISMHVLDMSPGGAVLHSADGPPNASTAPKHSASTEPAAPKHSASTEPAAARHTSVQLPTDAPALQSHTLRMRRRSVRELLNAQPDLLRVLGHVSTAYLCFAVDVVVILHLIWQLMAHTLLAAPHLSLHGVIFLGIFVLAALRAVAIAGVGSPSAWFSAWGQVLFAVVPLRITSQLMLRAAPRSCSYVSVVIGLACNAVLQALATVLVAVPSRGEGYAWRNSWRRVVTSWVLLAVHCSLVLAVFAAHRGVAARRVSVLGAVTGEGPSAAKGGGLEDDRGHAQAPTVSAGTPLQALALA